MRSLKSCQSNTTVLGYVGYVAPREETTVGADLPEGE